MAELSSKRTGRTCVAAVLLATLVGGCGSSGPRAADDPLTIALNPTQTGEARAKAVGLAYQKAVSESDRIAARSALWPLVWSPQAAPEVKVAIVQELLAERNPVAEGVIREDLRLMLPHQNSPEVVTMVCTAAGERGWTDFIPAIVRSYARVVPGFTDATRSERAALIKLGGGKDLEAIIFGVFAHPPADTPETKRMKLEEQYRLASWDLLSRLEPTGERRIAMLETAAADVAYARSALAAWRELRALPQTGEELRWASRLHDPKNAANAAWWAEARSAIASLDATKTSGLELRHAEAIRAAAIARPNWISASREQLLGEVRLRLKDREVIEPSRGRDDGKNRIKESLGASEAKLRWADLLTILLVDDAIQDAMFGRDIFTYVGFDKRDTTTEYGGVLDLLATPGKLGFVATLYQPRPGQRAGDDRFIASDDMINSSDRSLAHFHFHVAERYNSKFAGPSDADLDYSNRFGRSCLVFTSRDSESLDVDYYQPGVVIVDLGDIKVAK
ncbi:MAG: hypothetical protein AABZ53_17475 [Planctomycetota bacterium]